MFCADTDIITLIYCSRERKYNSVLFGVKTEGSVVVFTRFLFYYVSTHTTPNRIFSTHADAHEARKATHMLKHAKAHGNIKHAKQVKAMHVLAPVGAHDAEPISLKESKDHKLFKYYTYGT